MKDKSIANILKKIAVTTIHRFGFDVFRVPRDIDINLLGLKRFPIRSIIDIGANRGQFAVRAMRAFPEANLYCFEPLPDVFLELKDFADKNYPGRITVYNNALGDKEVAGEILMAQDHDESSSFLKPTKLLNELCPSAERRKKIIVETTTLDKAVSRFLPPLVDDILIKMDVEGYEDRVISGGRETFKKAKACIVEISLDNLYEGQATFFQIFSLMTDLNFNYIGNLDQVIANDGRVIYINAIFLKYSKPII